MIANQSSVAKRGIDLLRDPQLNKSTAFTAAERESLGLTGLLPAAVHTEETQVQRALQQLGEKPTDLERYIYLIQLLDTDETLFYKVLMSDPARFLPIVYELYPLAESVRVSSPQAVQSFSRQDEGL
jgi:malate dehydrogenase (oxaloacetate-decarboxylating)(NADP+)